jgi:hypothetical protein
MERVLASRHFLAHKSNRIRLVNLLLPNHASVENIALMVEFPKAAVPHSIDNAKIPRFNRSLQLTVRKTEGYSKIINQINHEAYFFDFSTQTKSNTMIHPVLLNP